MNNDAIFHIQKVWHAPIVVAIQVSDGVTLLRVDDWGADKGMVTAHLSGQTVFIAHEHIVTVSLPITKE